MTAEQARAWFTELPQWQKPLFVSLLAHNLTVAARGWHPGQEGAESAAARYWVFNELQHTVSAKLIALSSSDEGRFPDEGFLDVLFERAEDRGCGRDLLQAIAWSVGAMR